MLGEPYTREMYILNSLQAEVCVVSVLSVCVTSGV